MKKIVKDGLQGSLLGALVAISSGALPAYAQSSSPISTETMTLDTHKHDKTWDMILGKYVSSPDVTGLARFDYAALNASEKDQNILGDYIASLEAKTPSNMSDAEATAYWANLYNAVTIRIVTENYPVKSIREIKSGAFSKGPWGRKVIHVNGEHLSLDDVEHEILRKQFPSPLIHYMVNCASVGCPNLKPSVWNSAALEKDRDAAARAFINSPRGVRITKKGLKVSSIYKWFKADFGGSKASVISHLREYADEDLAFAIDQGAKIVGYDYDWALNE